jgi:hypothetical protein
MEYIPTEEDKLETQRQILFFDIVIKYLLDLGFKMEKRGCFELQFSYHTEEYTLSVELQEGDGEVLADVHEFVSEGSKQGGDFWSFPSDTFDPNELRSNLSKSFKINGLK